MSSKRPVLTDQQLGAYIRYRRLEIGLSQTNLAQALGVTFQQVQKYESGGNRIAAARLLDLARVLEMPVGRFFEALDTTPRSAGSVSDAVAVELLRLYVEAGPLRSRILAIVQACAADQRD